MSVTVGAAAWVYAMGRYRTGTIVKLTPTRVFIEWTAPSSQKQHRRDVGLGYKGWRRAWGIVGEDAMTWPQDEAAS